MKSKLNEEDEKFVDILLLMIQLLLRMKGISE